MTNQSASLYCVHDWSKMSLKVEHFRSQSVYFFLSLVQQQYIKHRKILNCTPDVRSQTVKRKIYVVRSIEA